MINEYKIINGAKYLSSGILQNYLVFISAKKYLTFFTRTTEIYSCKSNGISEKSIKKIATSENSSAPTWISSYPLADARFNGNCVTNNKMSIPGKVISLYTSYSLGQCSRDLNTNFTLNYCLFGSAELTKNTDTYKYNYSDYGIGLDSRFDFSLTDSSVDKNVIIFEADMNSSAHIDNKNKDILILGEGLTQGRIR